MKIIIDESLCMACASWGEICPEVFELPDDKAVNKFAAEEKIPEEYEDDRQQAAKACPVEAIVIREELLKRRIPMKTLGEFYQSADWKKEKHVPVIECADSIKADEKLTITVTVGKEIVHPNTTEHHIRWIQLFFKPDDEKFIYQIAFCSFDAHGDSIEGANKGCTYTEPLMTVKARIKKSGTLHAINLCNIHGVWESFKTIFAS